MSHFIFSADAHLNEPPELFTKGLPEHLQPWAINSVVTDEKIFTRIGEKVMIVNQRNWFGKITRNGSRDLGLRFKDMDDDGVDAELVFPMMGLMLNRIDNPEAEAESCRIYNDFCWDYLKDHLDRLVPVAALPCRDLDASLAEMKRAIAMGFPAVMLPVSMPEDATPYNNPAWDPFFALTGEAGVPIIFHTATGSVAIRAIRGPGGALFNYTRQINDSIDTLALLVGGGVLDRNPKAKIVFVEHGAGWLMGAAERMDEVYEGHHNFIEPKLNRMPSQIVKEQVICTFQSDHGCLVTRKIMGGTQCFLFATDYPHAEGTFPYSRDVVARMFDDVPEITEQEKAEVLGLNAARLFRLRNPKLQALLSQAA